MLPALPQLRTPPVGLLPAKDPAPTEALSSLGGAWVLVSAPDPTVRGCTRGQRACPRPPSTFLPVSLWEMPVAEPFQGQTTGSPGTPVRPPLP